MAASSRVGGARGSAALFVARSTGLAMATACSLLLARLLGPDDFGVYATAVAVGNLAVLLGPMGVDQLQLLHDLPERRAARWASRVAAASVAASLVLALVWPDLDPLTRVCVFLMGAAGAARIALAPWLTTPQKQLRFDIRGRREFALNVFPALGAVVGAAVWASVVVVVGSYFSILVAIAVLAFWATSHDRGEGPHGSPAVRFRSGWPYAFSAATYTAYFTADSAIIAATRPHYEVGQYKAAYMFITAATVLPIVLNNDILRARLAHLRDSRTRSWSLIRRMFAVNLMLGSAMSLGTYLLGPWAAGTVYGQGFERAATVLGILSLALLPSALNIFSGNALIGIGRVRTVLAVQFGLCVANISSNMILVPAFGLDAAAYTTVGTEVLGAVCLGGLLLRTGRRSSATGPTASPVDAATS